MKKIHTGRGIRRPAGEEIRRLAAASYLDLSETEALEYAAAMDVLLNDFVRLDDLPQPRLEVKYKDRDPGYRPDENEDPYNIFIRKCTVRGSASGALHGKRVGLKDAIMVAGVPMTCGSRLLAEGFVPDIDAVVVERLLDAGATIVGKLNQDEFGMGGTGQTSAFGSTRNPRNPDYSPGGSSSGSGAAVAAGEVDIALGLDARGSGLIPAAWCGVVCIRATHGLVPAFGTVYMDHTLDFVTPITPSVEAAALAPEVIAGEDERDPQWVRGPIKVDRYSENLGKSVKGLRIGVLKEAFEWTESQADVSDAVRQSIEHLRRRGAEVSEVSLPLFEYGEAIWLGIGTHSVSAMIESDQEGYWKGGHCNVAWQAAFGNARRARADDLLRAAKFRLILGAYLKESYHSTYFSKAQNLRMGLRDGVSALLGEVDVLVTPTTPQKPFKLEQTPDPEGITLGTSMSQNTSPFNLTGHPALSVPCGERAGLPVGIQLITRHWEERLLFQVGSALEAANLRVRADI